MNTKNYDPRVTRQRWKVANSIAEVLGCGSRVAWNWMRTLRAAGIDLMKLADADVDTVDRARTIMQTKERLPPKGEKWVSPLDRAARRTAKNMIKEDEQSITLRDRVQIMLWAIGKCGSVEVARDALDRACSAIEEANTWTKEANSGQSQKPNHNDDHGDKGGSDQGVPQKDGGTYPEGDQLKQQDHDCVPRRTSRGVGGRGRSSEAVG